MIKISIAEAGKHPQLLTFNQDAVTLGRSEDNDLRLTGKGVSGHHCRIRRQGAGYVLEDVGSTNGSYVNRQRVTAPVPVSGNDEIVIAVYKIKVLADAAMGAAAVPSGKAAVMGDAGAQILTSAPPVSGLGSGPTMAHPAPAQDRTAHEVVAPAGGPWSGQGAGAVPVANPYAAGPSQPPTSGAYAPSGPSLPPGSGGVVPSGPSQPPSGENPGAQLISRPPSAGAGVASGLDPSDLEWGREWEQIDKIATAWLASGKDGRHLLRGDKLAHARRWLSRGRGKSPAPKPLHQAYILASARSRSLKMAGNLTLAALVLGGASAGGVYAWHRRGAPVDDVAGAKLDVGSDVADTEEAPTDAPLTGDRAASDAIAAKAETYVATDPELATLIAMAALSKLPPDEPAANMLAPASRVFRDAVLALQGRPLRGHEAGVTNSAVSPDARFVVTGTGDQQGVARLWDLSMPGVLAPGMLRGHAKPLTGMEIGADGRFLVTVDADGLAQRWDLMAPDPPSTSVRLEDHGAPISALDISDDGRLLATGDEAGEIRVWDLQTKRPEAARLSGHSGKIQALDFDASGNKLVSASDDLTGRVWRLAAGMPSGRAVVLEGHEVAVQAAALSPDGAWAITGGADGRAMLWNANSQVPGRTVLLLEGHSKAITFAAVAPNGEVAVTAGDDDTLRTWELRAKDPMARVVKFTQHTGAIRSLVINGPAEDAASQEARPTVSLTASADGTAQLWNLDKRGTIIDARKFTSDMGEMYTASISADGRSLVTGGESDIARVWDAQAKSGAGASLVARAHRDAVGSVAVNKSGTRMMTGSVDGTARVWDLEPGREPRVLATLGEGTSKIGVVAINPRGSFGVSGAEDGTVRLWDLKKPGPKAFLPLAGHTSEIRGLVFSADEKWLATASTDRTVRLWNMQSTDPGAEPIVLPHDDEVVAVAISGDSRWLLSASIRSAVLWSLTAENPAAGSRPLAGHEDDVVAVALGPRGRWAATGSVDRKVILRDLTTKDAEGIRLRAHDEPVRVLAFRPTGTWLATADDGGMIRLWNVDDEYPDEGSLELRGHDKGIQALAWAEDGSALVSAGNDSTIRLWPVDDEGLAGEALVLRGHDALVRDLALPTELEFIVSASYDNSARVWPLRASALISIGCTRVGRDLSDTEWSEHAGGDNPSVCAPH
jgi:WD40 repeat protein